MQMGQEHYHWVRDRLIEEYMSETPTWVKSLLHTIQQGLQLIHFLDKLDHCMWLHWMNYHSEHPELVDLNTSEKEENRLTHLPDAVPFSATLSTVFPSTLPASLPSTPNKRRRKK